MKNARHSKGLEWCPEADLNHRHADFQSRSVGVKSKSSSDNSVKLSIADQILSSDLSNAEASIEEAAIWLSQNSDQCAGRIIPALKTRFGLRNIQAIEATKRAHTLRYVRAL